MLKLSGEVRSSFERKDDNGKVFMNSYQVEVMNGNRRKLIDLNEYGEKGSFHIGQSITDVPVRFKKSDYNDDGIEFNVVKNGRSEKAEEKKRPAIGNV